MSNPTLFLYTGNGTLAAQDRSGSLTLTGSGAVRYAPASGARTNLIYNPTFASGVTGVIASLGGSVSHEATGGVDGTGAARWTGSTINQGIRVNTGAANYVGRVNGNVSITFSFAAKAVSGATDWKIDFLTYDNAWNNLATSSATAFDITSDHARYSFEYTATGTGTHYIIPRIRRASTAAAIIEIDQLVLEVGSTDGSWFEPVWLDPLTGILGSANASPSVSQAAAWVEEGTTNLVTDPLTNNNPTGSHIRGGGGSVYGTDYGRSTAYAYGAATGSWFRTSDGVNASRGLQFPVSTSLGLTGTARPYSGQMRVRVAGGATDIRASLIIRYTDATFSTPLTLTKSVGDEWVLFELENHLANAAKTIDYVLPYVEFVGTPSGRTLYVTYGQAEQKANCSSLCAGSIGTGYAWSGTAHASSSTRTAAVFVVNEVGHINSVRGALAARLARTSDTGGNVYIMWAGVDGTNDFIGPRIDSSDRASLICKVGAGSYSAIQRTGAISVDTWVSYFSQWDGTAIALSINDEAQATGSRDTPGGSLLSASDLRIAGNSSGAAQLNGYIGPVLITDRPLTARERAILAARTQWAWATLKGRRRIVPGP